MTMALEQTRMIPATLPATGQDLFNYLAAYGASNHQIHLVLRFAGHIDQELLAKAVRLSMDLEPVLGCRFVEHEQTAYFERRTDLDRLDLCPVVVTEDPEKHLREFVAQATDSRKDLMIQTRLFRSATDDLLCIKLDHTCSDGGGLKEYSYFLADVYNQLHAGQERSTHSGLPYRDCHL